MKIKNPILCGFNPDPSIIRVGEDYYIATSTFEWFPGVQIHHSKDLVHWELISRPLNRLTQLDLCGVPDSGGVWAPCLSYADDTFYLVYSNVHSFDGIWKDTPNYLLTTEDIRGEWSDPIFLSSSGFDGSLYHDEDGKKWYLSMLSDHRKGRFFGGIFLQQYDPVAERLIGPAHNIFEGTELGLTEGPHLYKKDGYYYLLTAEGGTEYGHAVSIARSENITGPYEVSPDNPIISAKDHPEAIFQKTGHADMVQTQNGKWYIVCLTGRPLSPLGRCTLGRETVIEEIEWKQGDWPRLANGTRLIREEIPATPSSTIPQPPPTRTLFSPEGLDISFQSLRIPATDAWCNLENRPGWLRLYGQESLSSLHRQSIIARRVQSFHIEATTSLDFNPINFQQMAGLIAYYNTYHWHYLHIMGGDNGKRFLQIITCDKYDMQEVLDAPIELPAADTIQLKLKWKGKDLQFYYALANETWQKIGSPLDGSILSDDYVRDEKNRYRPAFTGAFVGMCCQDLSGQKQYADFEWWEYGRGEE